ncbi:hypothetical protein [Dictyobacter kobayashii]|nr:hypothetical protein [Dictyobacter kobayashii]
MLTLGFGLLPAHLVLAASAAQEFNVAGGKIQGNVIPVVSQQAFQASATHSPNIQSFKVPSGLLQPSSISYFSVLGQAISGSYIYSYDLTAPKGIKLGAVELALNTQAHTQLIAVGTPTSALTNPSTKNGISASQSISSSGTVSPLVSNRAGNFHTDWWDPVGIHVNEVLDDINFNYDGRSVTYYSGSDYRWWLSNDGWFEAAHNIGSSYQNNNTQAVVWTYDHMQNNPFCVANATHVYYQNNNVYAHGNGSVTGNVSTSDSGPCAFLLHYTTSVG